MTALRPCLGWVAALVFFLCPKGLFIGNQNVLNVTSDVSEECREGFLETNKKTNYIARQETARQIY